jgi:hypothetical protein
VHGREIELDWDACDRDGWGRLLARAGRSSLEQSWAYGEALAATEGCRVHRAVATRGERPVALVQAFEKHRFLPLVPLRILRGPLWLEEALPADSRAAVLRLIKRHFRLAKRRLLIWSPELPETPASHALMRFCGSRQMVTGYSTPLLDLAPPVAELRRGLHGKWRNMLVGAEQAELAVQLAAGGRNFDWLVERSDEFRRRSGFIGTPGSLVRAIAAAAPHKDDILVLTAKAGRERVAGVLLVVHGATATYLLGWTGPEGRKRHAQHLLLWRGSQEMKRRGVRWLDLGGVNAAAPGLARFKLGLGGRLHTLAGTFI